MTTKSVLEKTNNQIPSSVMVTVICTTYNQETYIEDALKGFVSQKTKFPFEVIVHDDASRDNTADIIRKYAELYPDIIIPIYETENQYSKHDGSIKKACLPFVRGKYVCYCEGDDYWIDSDKLQKQVTFLEKNKEYSLVATSSQSLDCQTGRYDNRFVIYEPREISLIKDLILQKDGSDGRVFQTSSVMIKKEVYLDDQEWAKDFPYGDRVRWITASFYGKLYMLSDITSVYRLNAVGSWTLRNTESDQKAINIIMKEISGFRSFDKYTNYKYSEHVKEAISRLSYNLSVHKKEWAEITSSENKKYFDKLSKLQKILLFIRCKWPKFYILICQTRDWIRRNSKSDKK